ncbi:Dihydropteroate synthase [hydrothermal vent metagenome]|uniref:dihydropteroate synthase n=1 Tax=hydrothermal vent metagenome TaxID=652676 RepID=A0A3B1BS58_9ZZZZ
MGILNITPDSFSDGGDFFCLDAALEQAHIMVEEGAAIIDVGGESTRPDAQPVSVEEELERVVPIIERITRELSVLISIDTSKPAVMQGAVEAGAGLINDVMALQAPDALEVAARLDVPVCLVHMQGEPRTMQHLPRYQDVVSEVKAFLAERIACCKAAGIALERLVVDPGFGFGKTLEHNLKLLKHLATLTGLGVPVMAGISRKSMIGALLDNAQADQRLHGGLAAAVLAVSQGVKIIRTHDVKPTVDALAVATAVNN